jgi:TPR repeat protein
MLFVIASLVIAISGFQVPTGSAGQTAAAAKNSALTAHEMSEIQTGAAKGDPLAELRLARAYSVGHGVTKSAETALEWYRKAADGGNAEAQDAMGIIYMTGDGVVRDKALAVTWYRKAARLGICGRDV